MNEFKKLGEKKYRSNYIDDLMLRGYYTAREQAEKCADLHVEELKKSMDLISSFEKIISKIDTTCGGMLGEGEQIVYEKVKVTKYRKEIKAFEIETGSIKDGQCFVVKTSFNYGHSKGYVYRIHETEYNGRISYHACKLNGKLTKECTGHANSSNYWYISPDFTKWFDKGALAWCELQEVSTPYEVEKVVKKKVVENETDHEPAQAKKAGYTYKIERSEDTRDGSALWIVRIVESLDRAAYIAENKLMKERGGYYSRFRKGFIFRFDPSEILNAA